MKINCNPYVKFQVVNKFHGHLVYTADTYEEAVDFVRENWVEGEDFEIEIQAVTRYQCIVLCTITDSDPLDEVTPENREVVKTVMTLLGKQDW